VSGVQLAHVTDILLLVLAALAAVDLLLLAAYLANRVGTPIDELRKCREESQRLLASLAEKERALKEHYEQLLRDSAIRNSMMVGLWNAYRSGEVVRCYKGGGSIRVLADGTVVCERGEESYAVRSDGTADK